MLMSDPADYRSNINNQNRNSQMKILVVDDEKDIKVLF
jgi:hypothetical protein